MDPLLEGGLDTFAGGEPLVVEIRDVVPGVGDAVPPHRTLNQQQLEKEKEGPALGDGITKVSTRNSTGDGSAA